MNLPRRSGRRGQPLLAFAIILLGWIGVRSVLWASSVDEVAAPLAQHELRNGRPARPEKQDWPSQLDTGQDVRDKRPARRPVTIVPLDPVDEPLARPTTSVPPRIAAGHRLLFLAGASAIPAPPEERAAGIAAGFVSPFATGSLQGNGSGSPWSADAWIMWREGGNGYNLPGRGLPATFVGSGAYGASQAGLVLRYRLAPHEAHRATAYLRATGGLDRPRGEELAAGLSLRLIQHVPIAIMGEVRAAPSSDGVAVRPAAAIVTELPAVGLPLGMHDEVYGQAGWVGGRNRTAFVDGQARIDKRIGGAPDANFSLGLGAWAGAQAGSSRIDAGPSLRLDIPVGGTHARLTADYRWRVAGRAAPDSGAAITFSAGF